MLLLIFKLLNWFLFGIRSGKKPKVLNQNQEINEEMFKISKNQAVMVHAFEPSTWTAEVGESLVWSVKQVPGQSELYRDTLSQGKKKCLRKKGNLMSLQQKVLFIKWHKLCLSCSPSLVNSLGIAILKMKSPGRSSVTQLQEPIILLVQVNSRV